MDTMLSKVTPKLVGSNMKSEEKLISKVVPQQDRLQPAINTIFENVTRKKGNEMQRY